MAPVTPGAWHLLMGLRTSCFSRWVAPKGIQWFSQVPSRHHHHFEADLRTHFTRKRPRKPNISMYLCTPGAWHLLMGRSMAMGRRKSCFSGWVAPNGIVGENLRGAESESFVLSDSAVFDGAESTANRWAVVDCHNRVSTIHGPRTLTANSSQWQIPRFLNPRRPHPIAIPDRRPSRLP